MLLFEALKIMNAQYGHMIRFVQQRISFEHDSIVWLKSAEEPSEMKCSQHQKRACSLVLCTGQESTARLLHFRLKFDFQQEILFHCILLFLLIRLSLDFSNLENNEGFSIWTSTANYNLIFNPRKTRVIPHRKKPLKAEQLGAVAYNALDSSPIKENFLTS